MYLYFKFNSSTTGPRPNFQFASFPGGPGIPAGVSIQMGSIPPGMPVPGMFGPGQIGNLIGNLIGIVFYIHIGYLFLNFHYTEVLILIIIIPYASK